jgi:hypothetical protein
MLIWFISGQTKIVQADGVCLFQTGDIFLIPRNQPATVLNYPKDGLPQVMDLVGDYSENPFEGLSNDVPMLALSRTIEIDLQQQLGETDLPASIQSINHVLL